jgi:hypothetical protein
MVLVSDKKSRPIRRQVERGMLDGVRARSEGRVETGREGETWIPSILSSCPIRISVFESCEVLKYCKKELSESGIMRGLSVIVRAQFWMAIVEVLIKTRWCRYQLF